MSKLTSLFFTMVFTVLVVGNAQGQMFLKNKNPDVIWVNVEKMEKCPGSSSLYEKVVDRELVRARIKRLDVSFDKKMPQYLRQHLRSGGIGSVPSLRGATGIIIQIGCIEFESPLVAGEIWIYGAVITGKFTKFVSYDSEDGEPPKNVELLSSKIISVPAVVPSAHLAKEGTAENTIADAVEEVIKEMITLYLKANHDL